MKVLTSLAAALVAVALISCTKQEAAKAEKAVEKVAAEAKGAAESAAKELEAREVAIDAYIYAYPLVTMEMTRRVLTNVEKAEGSKAPMGHFARLRNYPAVDDHAVNGAECRHAVHADVARCDQGAVDRQHPGHEGPLLPVPDARRLDQCLPGPGQAHHGHEGAEVRDHRTGLDRNVAGRRHRVQIADFHGLDSRTDLLHGHPGGLQGGARAAGPGVGRSAVRVGQAVHAARWKGRSPQST